jgi:adenosine deaminase
MVNESCGIKGRKPPQYYMHHNHSYGVYNMQDNYFNNKFRKLINGVLILAILFMAGCASIPSSGIGPDQYLEKIRHNRGSLEAFVRQMPKGGDLHTHLSGAVDAESYLRWASSDRMCINMKTWKLSQRPCEGDSQPAEVVLSKSDNWHKAVDTLSVRNYPIMAPRFGHDHFFATFSLFDNVVNNHWSDMLAEVATKAEADNTDYLELMRSFEPDGLYSIAAATPWTGDLQTWHDAVVASVRALVPSQKKHLDEILAGQKKILSCDSSSPTPACRVTIRFIHHAIRLMDNPQVFISLINGAELAKADGRVVGIDLVAPEDHPASLANYTQHMRMVAFLKEKYPGLQVNLHAGELSAGFVQDGDLTFHITEAVKLARANRLGHGVDIMHEPGWQDLLKDMAARRIGVAMLFTSNHQILGITGDAHPFRTYMAAGVPVVISTDDQGVSRSNHTAEFARAITTYNLTWTELKTLIRTSLDISFLAGQGLWKTPGDYSIVNSPCSVDTPGKADPAPHCTAFLKANDKAAEQWRLEKRLAEFEAKRW